MRIYMNATYLFVVAVLVALVVSYVYGILPQATALDAKSDEIGDQVVSEISNKLRDPLLALLTSIKFTKKTDFQRRLDDAQNALNSFKQAIGGMLMPAQLPQPMQIVQPMQQVQPTPMPMQSSMPTVQPTPPMPTPSIPLVQQIIEPTPMPVAMQTPSAPPAPVQQPEVPTMEVPAQTEPMTVTPPQPSTPLQMETLVPFEPPLIPMASEGIEPMPTE